MRITLIRKGYHKRGGAEKSIVELAESLVKYGHEVNIISQVIEKDNRIDSNISFHKIPFIKLPHFLNNLVFAVLCERLINKSKYDIIHSFERIFNQDIYRAGDGCHKEWIRKKRQINNFISNFMDELSLDDYITLLIEKRIFEGKGSKKIVANSEMVKRNILENYKVKAEKIITIFNGVDLDKFNPEKRVKYYEAQRNDYGIPNDYMVIIFLGSGFKRKGLRYIIDALYILRNEKIILFIGGKGNFKKYNRYTRELEIEEKVKFTGFVENPELLYNMGDVLVLPTIYDPFSNVCLEAMACGLPIITTDDNGISELIDEKNCGYIIKSKDKYSIADSIKKLMDRERRNNYGLNSRKIAEGYPISRMVQSTIKLYEEMI